MIKTALLKLLRIYLLIIASIGTVLFLVMLLTGGPWEGFPLPLAILGTLAPALILFGIFFAIGVGIAVYHDAKARDMEPLLWALVAAIVPWFLGLVAYLIARKPDARHCAACGATMPANAAYCPSCGAGTEARCASCNGVLGGADTRFCPHCGTAIAPPEPPPVEPAVAE